MSILIKGMEMPRLGYREIRIHPDGRITEDNEGYEETIGTTIPVPPHGRLIDADDFFRNFPELLPYEFAAPTIIEAEEEGE